MRFKEYNDQKDLVNVLEAIIDSSYDGLWICDRDCKVAGINRASEKINDVKADQVLGKKMEDLVREGLIDRSVTMEALEARTAITIIQKLRNGRGHSVIFFISIRQSRRIWHQLSPSYMLAAFVIVLRIALPMKA